MDIDTIYLRCGEAIETAEHAFHDCSWSKLFWKTGFLRIDITQDEEEIAIQDWILHNIKNKPKDFTEILTTY